MDRRYQPERESLESSAQCDCDKGFPLDKEKLKLHETLFLAPMNDTTWHHKHVGGVISQTSMTVVLRSAASPINFSPVPSQPA